MRSRRLRVMHLALLTRGIGRRNISSALSCHHNRLDLKGTQFGLNISDPFGNMLLSSAPLILVFESRPHDCGTLLNDMKRIVSVASHSVKCHILVLIQSLATFPAICKRFLHN